MTSNTNSECANIPTFPNKSLDIVSLLRFKVFKFIYKIIKLVKEILDLFDKEIEAETLSNIKKRLSDEVKKINRCVNDYLFDNDSINDINHIVSRTELIFGIPKVVKICFSKK
jgi:hypothetical protein